MFYNDKIILIDFGMCLLNEQQHENISGTISYMPLEIL